MAPYASSLPIFGSSSTYTWVENWGKVPFMGKCVTEVISENLSLYIGDGRKFPSQSAVQKIAGVPQSTLQRALAKEGNVRVDNLERLSKAVGLSPWQLLVPGLRTDVKPELLPPYGPGDHEAVRPPLLGKHLDRLSALTDLELREIETALEAALAMVEGRRKMPRQESIAEAVLKADTSQLIGSPEVRKRAARTKKIEER